MALELTAAEERALGRMVKRQQLWRRNRWFGITGGATLMYLGAFTLHYLLKACAPGNNPTLAMVAPAPWMLFAIGVTVASETLINWKGNVRDGLILKLVRRESGSAVGVLRESAKAPKPYPASDSTTT